MTQEKIDIENINTRLDETLEKLLSDIYREYDIAFGDMTQDQELEYDNLINGLGVLFKTLIEQNRRPEINFTTDNLRQYKGAEIQICGYTFKLYLGSDLSGEYAVWSCKPYVIYATPGFEFISVPVDVRDNESDETIGDDEYNDPINTFDEYKLAVKIMAARIIKKYETGK
jgi:hypothetical protein